MEEIINVIENFGFPVVLVIYLLTRFEKRFLKVIESIEELESLLRKTVALEEKRIKESE